MFRFWERFDFIYNRTAAYQEQIRHFNLGRRFVHHLCSIKTEYLNAQLANSGYDQLANEQRVNQLTFMHKCLLARRCGQFTEEHLQDEMETILIGGIDTTATTLTNVMMMLAMYPTVQEMVRNEMLSVVGAHFNVHYDNVLPEHCHAMTYTGQVIQESLRLLPAGPYLSRTCTAPLKLSKNNFAHIINLQTFH